MGLKPGQTNNRKGRPKGIPNRMTSRIKKRVETFISRNWKIFETDFKELKPRDRVYLFEKLLAFAIPKQNTIDVTSDLKKMLENLDENTLTEIAEEILKLQNINKHD